RYQILHPGGGPDGHDIARPAEFLVDSSGTVRWTNFTEDIRVRARADEMRAGRRPPKQFSSALIREPSCRGDRERNRARRQRSCSEFESSGANRPADHVQGPAGRLSWRCLLLAPRYSGLTGRPDQRLLWPQTTLYAEFPRRWEMCREPRPGAVPRS